MKKWVIFLLTMAAMLLVCPALADELLAGTQNGYASITEAVAAAQNGDVIRIAAGVYDDTVEVYPIVIDKSVSLIGEPGVVLKSPPFKALLWVEADDVQITNIDFQLLKWGIVCTGDNLNVMNCRFSLADEKYRVSSCGIWLAGAYNATIKDNAFTGCSLCMAGPPLSESSKGKVVLTGLFEVGDDTAYFTSHKVEGNTVNGKPLYVFFNQTGVTVPKDAGQVIVACCTDVALNGLDVSDASIGAFIVYCDNVNMTDVKADRGGIFGVYLAFVNGGRLQGVISQKANHGIDVRAAKKLIIQNCTTVECEQGIFLSWVKDSLVVDCSMLDGGRGLFMAMGQNNQIENCIVSNNENGICTEGDVGVLITNCMVSGNTVAGIRLLRGEATCLNNNILDNWTGMIVSDTTPVTLSGNRFVNNQSCGLYLRALSNGKIVMNQFEGETESFITVDSDMAGILMIGFN